MSILIYGNEGGDLIFCDPEFSLAQERFTQ